MQFAWVRNTQITLLAMILLAQIPTISENQALCEIYSANKILAVNEIQAVDEMPAPDEVPR